ncbi:hypothetical protein [Novipirellula artificiosorum]|uniref:hypothetical protein n=1 Tax=Novipirellula artificiosorum TaxID=2528016 RepID=UPI0011B58C0B|nr:hypothetical protein [Novipirellula artificiosorum]
MNTGRLLAADLGPPEEKGKPEWGSSLAFYAAMADLMPIESRPDPRYPLRLYGGSSDRPT